MLICLFARADHPPGWGYPKIDSYDQERGAYLLSDPSARAHGYSLVAVRCADDRQAGEVIGRMASGFHGLDGQGQYVHGHLGDWFGGSFDLVAKLRSESDIDMRLIPGADSRFVTAGDNRFIGIFDAAEVLGAAPAPTAS